MYTFTEMAEIALAPWAQDAKCKLAAMQQLIESGHFESLDQVCDRLQSSFPGRLPTAHLESVGESLNQWEILAFMELSEMQTLLWEGCFLNAGDLLDRLSNTVKHMEQLTSRDSLSFIRARQDSLKQVEYSNEAFSPRTRLGLWARANRQHAIARDVLDVLDDFHTIEMDYARDTSGAVHPN